MMDGQLAMRLSSTPGPIGVFDSGYGGLTILRQIRKLMPQYDYVYLGDNARTPYGTRSSKIVYEFTLQAVRAMFRLGCPLVILGCNTASAKALRSIQMYDLPQMDPSRRVLGVIRPTVECIGDITRTRHVGLVATQGTVRSMTYEAELSKLYPDITVVGEACPMWVPLVENYEFDTPGADYFVKKYIDNLLSRDPEIDTLILGCTHYPLLLDKIRAFTPPYIHIVEQGPYVAGSLQDYLCRHTEMEKRITRNGTVTYYTTEQPETFNESATIFMNGSVCAKRIHLNS